MEESLGVQMDADAGHVSFVQSAAAVRASRAEVILSFCRGGWKRMAPAPVEENENGRGR
jgi:hypothetical protein